MKRERERWIKLWACYDHPIFRARNGSIDAGRFAAWTYVLLRANWGRYRGLEAGELRLTRAELAKTFDLTEKQARGHLDAFKREGMIDYPRQAVIRVQNWGRYQGELRAAGRANFEDAETRDQQALDHSPGPASGPEEGRVGAAKGPPIRSKRERRKEDTDPGAGGAGSRGGKKALESTPHGRALLLFDEGHQGLTGLRYTANFARDLKLLKDLVDVHGEALTRELVEAFFMAQDWARQHDFTHSNDPRHHIGKIGLDVPGLKVAIRHLSKAYKFDHRIGA